MSNLKDIRSRIDSVKNTRQITKAMKMVAAAKLQQAQERLEASRPYTRRMARLIDGLADRVDPDAHPLLERRENPDETLVVIVGSNRGLCGNFNSSLFRVVDRYLDEQRIAGEDQKLCIIGQEAHNHYSRTDYEIVQYYPDVIEEVNFENAQRIARFLTESFLGEDYDSVYLCYNQFISAIKTNWSITRLLPISMLSEVTAEDEGDLDDRAEAGDEEDTGDEDDLEGEYAYEPDVDTLLDELLPSFVDAQVMQALMESETAEQASRMTAMDNATQNANDMIEDLTLEYNRARQAQITTEIVEIVSGAEALEG